VDLAVVKRNLVALSKGTRFAVTGTISGTPGAAPNASGEIVVVDGATDARIAVGLPSEAKTTLRAAASGTRAYTRQPDGRWWVVPAVKGAKAHLAAVLANPGELTLMDFAEVQDAAVVMLGTRLDAAGLGFRASSESGNAAPAQVIAIVDRDGGVRTVNIAGSWTMLVIGSALFVGDAATPVLLGLRLDPGALPAGRTVVLPKSAWSYLESDRLGYKVGFPPTWKQRVKPDYDLYAGPNRREVLVLTSNWGVDLAKLLAKANVWQWMNNRARPASVKKISVGGQQAWLCTFRMTRSYRSDSGSTYVPTLFQVLLVYEGTDYVIQWWGPKADEKAGLKAFKEILAGFEFTY
jgi:hypothetical protein